MNPIKHGSALGEQVTSQVIDFATYSNRELRQIANLIAALEKYGIEQKDDLITALVKEINRRWVLEN